MSSSDFSRRQFLGATAATVAGAAIGGAFDGTPVAAQAQGATAPTAPADLILVNGRIHTMDARNTIARTASIRNGRFVTVGDTTPPRRAGDRVIDLRGRTVVPGLIEPHVHIVSLANRP